MFKLTKELVMMRHKARERKLPKIALSSFQEKPLIALCQKVKSCTGITESSLRLFIAEGVLRSFCRILREPERLVVLW